MAREYRDANLDVVRGREREYARAHAEQKRDRAHMGRARRHHAPVVELVSRRKVYERDAAICHVCGEHVTWDEYEMDHVLPLARGGAHTYENVKVSHRLCNRGRRRWSP